MRESFVSYLETMVPSKNNYWTYFINMQATYVLYSNTVKEKKWAMIHIHIHVYYMHARSSERGALPPPYHVYLSNQSEFRKSVKHVSKKFEGYSPSSKKSSSKHLPRVFY